MDHSKLQWLLICCCVVAVCAAVLPAHRGSVRAQDSPTDKAACPDSDSAIEKQFQERVKPLLSKFCLRCHNEAKMKSGVRVDQFTGAVEERLIRRWEMVQRQIADEAMPPESEPQPTDDQRAVLVEWVERAVASARARKQEKNGSARRLTVAQYRNTLKDLLSLDDDLTDLLAPDAVSQDGFLNNEQTMLLSPLLLEAYFDIADRALDLCIVDEEATPVIQNFRVDLGVGVNRDPYPEKLILGANSHLLENRDVLVRQLAAQKPFGYEPFLMKTRYRFIEGYQGNATVRGWREYDSIYHAVFACMRGTGGYPKGKAYETVPEGLLLRPSIPSAELFGVESTYGPKANFKISLRELPDQGRFRVTVTAAKYDDGLLIDGGEALEANSSSALTVPEPDEAQTIEVEQGGVYQVDVFSKPANKPRMLSLKLGNRYFSGILRRPPFLVVRLEPGPLRVVANYGGAKLQRLLLTPLADSDPMTEQFRQFEKRQPRLGVHLGLRRDCGSTLTRVAEPQKVCSTGFEEFVFEDAISNYPSPDVEKDNVNYLAGIREIGVRSEYTDGRDIPRLVVRSVEFEGPYYETWPPASHRNIFIQSTKRDDPRGYAHEVLNSFASRAFRRQVTEQELASLLEVWARSFAESGRFRESIKDALLVVLTSPQFLFLIEASESPEAEPLTAWELASKLSYFLWNTAPDDRLLRLAAQDSLHDSLAEEIDRMIADSRFEQFAQEFTSQWLALEKFDVVEIDRERYPRLTRDTRKQLRKEPVQFLNHLIRNNLPLRHLVSSEFIVANEVVAHYYGLGDRTESGFEFVPIRHERPHLGGVVSQAAILAGLSDGRESNPVKRGAWLARKIIAEPPDDPPPNVPALPESDDAQLTLREKLVQHRDQEGCANCHAGIDPWGLPFEQYDAGGLLKELGTFTATSTLPDETQVGNAIELKSYLANVRIDQVAFSFLKHIASYAVGRSLSDNELEFLREKGLELEPDGYRTRDLIRFVIQSKLFLEK